MVKKIKEKGKTLFVCEECFLKYESEDWATKCEAFCKKYNACNIEITSHAIKEES